MLLVVTTFMSLARAEGEGKYQLTASNPLLHAVSFKTKNGILTLTIVLMIIEVELLGLRHRNETTNGPLTMVSMSGGLQFFVDGAGLDD